MSPLSPANVRWRWIELTLLGLIVPLVLVVYRHSLIGILVPILGVATLAVWIWSFSQKNFPKSQGASWRRLATGLGGVLFRVAVGAPIMVLLTWWFIPERLFAFPMERPLIWSLVMIAYPLVSVYPQEFLFRAAFVHRYRPILPRAKHLVIAGALIFGFWHLFFANPWAPILTLIGGYLFTRTYLKTRSLHLAALEHAIWGDLLFTIGPGWFFYTGSLRG